MNRVEAELARNPGGFLYLQLLSAQLASPLIIHLRDTSRQQCIQAIHTSINRRLFWPLNGPLEDLRKTIYHEQNV